MTRVPFNRPTATGRELEYIAEALLASHTSGNGPFTARCEQWLERATGASKVLLTHSGTGALELAAMLADLGPGDEAIMPSFTFSSTANAVALRGATPVFVDVEPDTLTIDIGLAAAAVTPRTKAVLPVHYAGVGADMEAVVAMASEHDLTVIEDAAQAILASDHNRPLGAIGDLGALSFHETKNVISGEGGALLLRDPDVISRAEVLQEKGTDRRAFSRGEVAKYQWLEVGSSFVASEITAAFLWAQLEHAEELVARRMRIWEAYHAGLESLEAAGVLRRPVIPSRSGHNGHIYYVLVRRASDRDAFIDGLATLGVNAVFHYVPLHSAPAGRRFCRAHGELPVTEELSARLVRLPLWSEMPSEQVQQVLAAVESVAADLALSGGGPRRAVSPRPAATRPAG